ncbi:hypothetical protein EDEG_00725 [Edhazardia aedis USNM 41457]|uniref:Uncharacterized protein n=1 Tax=Edhazardia aedis (strain USNM 41457) TaxID=1003232 RepID=J8ZZX3_EDHAE|nr:hypothetical protein EDEG_00725 [Edhazardia aedis USNM 41457]|eukprot:EJW05193.1 hypothetical protein EDEG_00725 [Edhazardia aedis USNM 41457]
MNKKEKKFLKMYFSVTLISYFCLYNLEVLTFLEFKKDTYYIVFSINPFLGHQNVVKRTPHSGVEGNLSIFPEKKFPPTIASQSYHHPGYKSSNMFLTHRWK